ncbi:zinc finger MYM-type protein 3 [Ischnura elegans]|uniref:zinc finger MYM-type protein 3 n=1 Tax=Ischnura elegans TaxID=197161 RepID=UPI001ED8AF20|nr:zinc finger MYM-type protein 3 [Ischnura elegans]
MEYSGTAGDADNSAGGEVTSESVSMEEQDINPREGVLQGNTDTNALVDSDEAKLAGTTSAATNEQDVCDESSEGVMDIAPVAEPSEKSAVETTEERGGTEDDVISTENVNESCKEGDEIETKVGSESSVGKLTEGITDVGEVDEVDMPGEVAVTSNNASPDLVSDETSRASDKNESKSKDPDVNNETVDNELDDAPLSKRARLDNTDSREDTSVKNPEALVKDSEISNSVENGRVLDDKDVEVVGGDVARGTLAQTAVKDEDKPEIIEDILTPRKRAKLGRPRKNSRPLDVIVENGSPEAEPHTDESPTGRPRRKAAQKAGDQIKQIVGSEEEITEILEKRKESEWSAEPKTETPPRKICYQCCRLRPCQYHLLVNGVSRYMCTTPCFQAFRRQHPASKGGQNDGEGGDGDVAAPTIDLAVGNDVGLPLVEAKGPHGKERTLECALCQRVVPPPTASEKSLSWETMEFCNEGCLGRYQDQLSSSCSHCRLPVQRISMGKYCVRFGYNIKQFCCSTCLEEFKKGLKTCTYCQKDISNGAEGFLAPVGDKGQFKDFCSPSCMEQYDHISSGTRPQKKEAACAVCDKVRPVISEVVTRRLGKTDNTDSNPPVYSLCSDPCFAAFKFVNEVKTEQCESCLRYFDTSRPEEKPTIFFHDGGYHCCCRACLNIFILTRRSIVQCNWCRVKKYDFDMIKRISSSGQVLMMCSLNCLSLYHVSISAVSLRRVKCDYCKELSQAQYHLTMSDATVRNFCSYECVMTFQSQYSKSPLTLPEEDMTYSPTNSTTGSTQTPPRKAPLTVKSGPVPGPGVESPNHPPPVPIISSVQSLASDRNAGGDSLVSGAVPSGANGATVSSQAVSASSITANMNYRQILVRPPNTKPMKNKATNCTPLTQSIGVGCELSSEEGEKKSDEEKSTTETSTQTDEFFLRGPILIPVPVPIYVPAPMAMYSQPFPVPTPFPLPIPVPILLPSKLSLKEIVQKTEVLSSVTPEEAEILMMAELVADESNDAPQKTDTRVSNSPVDGNIDTFQGDAGSDRDMDNDESSMASEPELPDVGVDLEEGIIVLEVCGPAYSEDEMRADDEQSDDKTRKDKGRKQRCRPKRSQPSTPQPTEEEIEDDPNNLKATLGVSAWQVWVKQKNSELSKVTSNSRRLKLFKTELLQMTLEELNYALCLFVKEVRKPGGGMYAPDTIFYFCLGIQHYLMENGRIDNIFTDLYFEKFTECLDQVATTFPPLTKETKLLETRVEEEHLWESQQLGAHSPYVLLSTLVFFNTKYFHLWTVQEHSQLTFANVIKVWKKPPSKHGNSYAEATASMLRLILPKTANDESHAKKKVYEQEENTSIPIRCPVKHYEFYMSKCPDPLKKVGDFFYLLPERACVPDSPVWYSSTALGPDALAKILHRIQMVKEVNKSYADEMADSMEDEKETSN